jgi:cytochrome c2
MRHRFLIALLLLVLVVISAGMFAAGFVAQKYKPVAYRIGKIFSRTNPDDIRKFLAGQYSRDAEGVPLDKSLDTALLPVAITGVRVSDHDPVAKTAGAIAAVKNTLVIVDRLGNFFSCSKSGTLRKLEIPPLPNGLNDYLRAGGTLDVKSFRTYSIKYLSVPKLLVVSHESYNASKPGTQLTVSAIAIDETTLQPAGPWRTIFATDAEPDIPNDASGGSLAVNGRDKIYLSVGVYKISNNGLAQDPQSNFGKIFEIDVASGQSRILSKGHRNPQGLTLSTSGDLWSTEHGPAGGDELNLITAGANYGWPNVTLGTNYNAYKWNDEEIAGRHDGYQQPIFAWVPSIGVSNLLEVRGFDERWNGDLLVGSLKAQTLFRLRLDHDRVVYSEPIWIGQRLRDIAEFEDGTIALWTDDSQILFLSPDTQRLASNRRLPEAVDERLVANCMFCHHLGITKAGDTAPSLTNLFGRKIGSDTYRYSASLRNKDGVWTADALKQFLSNPSAFANGTSMPSPNLSPEEIDQLVEVLKDGAAVKSAQD